MIQTENETLGRILDDFNLREAELSTGLGLLAETDSKYLRDLRINVSNALAYPNLNKKESYLISLAVGINEKNEKLVKAFTALAEKEGATNSEIAELHSLVSLMNINNVFYRFRHYSKKEYYTNTPAGIKMSIMMNPLLGKEFFELVSLAVSAVNGCEMCVNAHEQSVKQHGATEARIYDAIRLSAVIKGFSTIL